MKKCKFRCYNAAKILTKLIITSLIENPDAWEVYKNGLIMPSKDLAIIMTPRRFGLFMKVKILYHGTDVWVPVFKRLSIKRTAQKVLAIKLIENMKEE